ncbi:MAG: DegT/DnrJ/EryC1/StrS family aminotransferase, partial [Dethiosulfatibacter sp.]|nr:DegT/DnrJ/EryC1/StrS family aminotransferase [Dethiosulfatibacter sp.]
VDEQEKFQKYLIDSGIVTQIHYPIPPHLSKAYSYLNYGKGDYPITEGYSNIIISLPLYEGMTQLEINYVIDIINDYK